MIYHQVLRKNVMFNNNFIKIIHHNNNNKGLVVIMEMKVIDKFVSKKRSILKFDIIILDPPQSGPFFPTNVPIDHSNAINVRRHIYSPSQLPQGLTEGQLVMLLQKGNQYQQIKTGLTQSFPNQNEPQVIRNFILFINYIFI